MAVKRHRQAQSHNVRAEPQRQRPAPGLIHHSDFGPRYAAGACVERLAVIGATRPAITGVTTVIPRARASSACSRSHSSPLPTGNAGRSTPSAVRIHRGLLEPAPGALGQRVFHASASRAAGRAGPAYPPNRRTISPIPASAPDREHVARLKNPRRIRARYDRCARDCSSAMCIAASHLLATAVGQA